MNLPEAIEIGKRRVKDFRPGCDPEERDATKLLIKSGEREIRNRKDPDYLIFGLLPGETEE